MKQENNMSHTKDYWEKIRNYIIPKLGVFTQWIEDLTGGDYYVEGETHNNQFVGRVNMGEEEFEKVLDDLGFERNPLASLKQLKRTGETEEASFRKVDIPGFPDMQIHVVLYDGKKMQNADSDVTYVYAHWEMRWDTHPLKHYREKNFNAPEGARRMKDLLDQNGIEYILERPPAQ